MAAITATLIEPKIVAETSIAQTKEAQRIPLDKITLDELLILPGDLPTDFNGQQIKSELPKSLGGLKILKE